MKKIVVEEYNPIWKEEFDKAKSFYEALLQGVPSEIVHVGSTSVQSLWAKPILDIDIIVNNISDRDTAIASLQRVGYIHIGDRGVDGREAFTYLDDNPHINWMKHHLYLCIIGNQSLRNHLLLQKHLRKHRDVVEEYGRIKRNLAEKFPNDIDSYIAGKTEFIAKILNSEGMDKDEIDRIKAINKKN